MEDTKKKESIFDQYKELKKKHPDALLLFRCGDFYETYDADASIAASILGITLTKNNATGVNMAGFPFHVLDTYLPKLVRAGKRVAICDAIESTKETTKRGITEIITPGNNNNKTSEEKMEEKIYTQSDMDAKVSEVKNDAKRKMIEMTENTVKALGSNINSNPTLNAQLKNSIGILELLKVKHRCGVFPTKEEMLWLLEQAEANQKAENAATNKLQGFHR